MAKALSYPQGLLVREPLEIPELLDLGEVLPLLLSNLDVLFKVEQPHGCFLFERLRVTEISAAPILHQEVSILAFHCFNALVVLFPHDRVLCAHVLRADSVHDMHVRANHQSPDSLRLLRLATAHALVELQNLLRIGQKLHLDHLSWHFSLHSLIEYVAFPLKQSAVDAPCPLPLVDHWVPLFDTGLSVKDEIEMGRVLPMVNDLFTFKAFPQRHMRRQLREITLGKVLLVFEEGTVLEHID